LRWGVEEGETVHDTAKREIKEEMGLDIQIQDEVGSIEYVASHPTQGKIFKQIIYFLGKSDFGPITLTSEGGLDDARWFALSEIPKLKMYDNIAGVITNAIKVITEKYADS
jgi:NADH pyrophosphatase NudC (nudix superfamily)